LRLNVSSWRYLLTQRRKQVSNDGSLPRAIRLDAFLIRGAGWTLAA
jgi:hypothetical protein